MEQRKNMTKLLKGFTEDQLYDQTMPHDPVSA